MNKLYVCPKCRHFLNFIPVGYFCSDCQYLYPKKDGIDSFFDRDAFYEGKFTLTEPDAEKNLTGIRRFVYKLYRRLSQSHYRNFFIENMIDDKTGSIFILDVGCGGGSEFIAKFGTVCGIDFSLDALKNAASVYNMVVQTDMLLNPFADEIFDFIICKDVFGHISVKNKDKFCQEIYRLLKPGGRAVFSIELDSSNWLIQKAKKFPDLYYKYFVEKDGHIGLESIEQTCRHFRDVGFTLFKKIPLYKAGVTQACQYVGSYDNEYKEKSGFLKLLVKIAKFIDKRILLRGTFTFLAAVLDKLSNPWLPDECAQLLLLCCEKPRR